MIRAIVYSSGTGHTAQYAEMLGKECGIEVMECGEEKEKLSKTDEVIFLGWIRGGELPGLRKTASRCRVVCVGAVGMLTSDDATCASLRERHDMPDTPMFFLRGGLDVKKLHGVDRLIMKMITKTVAKAVEKGEDVTESDREFLRILREGGSFVERENLDGIIKWCNEYNSEEEQAQP